MKVKVGYIGINELEPVLNKVAQEFKELELNCYFYDSESDAINHVLVAEKENDVLLFGGPIPYKVVTKNHTLKKPSWFLSYNGAALYRGLLEMLYTTKKVTNRVSLDTVSKNAVTKIYEKLNLDTESIDVYEDEDPTTSDLTEFHLNKYNSGETDCALTCLRSTYLALKQKNVPTVFVFAPESAVREGIQKSILLHQSQTFRKSQIVVGLLELELLEELNQDYLTQQKQLEIHHALVFYAKKLHASLFQIDRWKFVFFTTQGMLEKQNAELFHLCVEEMNKLVHSKVQIGLGVGTSAQMASNRASVALKYANKEDKGIYMVDDQEQVIDVFRNNDFGGFYRIEDEDFTRLAKQSDLSPVMLRNLAEIVFKFEKTNFTAEEIANELSQTPRNVRRILKKLVDKNLATLTGEEHYSGKGRPKLVYNISFVSQT